ncbi:uncharacterized protein L3040_002191 [Drepanopeziza brunnea f. sp. 'multigermtubi']|nr:hypothetical protein L3040_002191 [Drepanopeziza brunnea f. sp. 'multigermtubi']
MWQINTQTFALHEGPPSFFRSEGYAILSHRWDDEEITFNEYHSFIAQLSSEQPLPPQLEKIRGLCLKAREQKLRWVWIDSCCINKGSSAELAEAIHSMFKWYRDSKVCFAYLGDVRKSESVARNSEGAKVSFSVFNQVEEREPSKPSVWFSRGWTLQELLAPRHMEFYDTSWELLGTKSSLMSELQEVTGIDGQYLRGDMHFSSASIATKMSWIANRTTVREEDMAYSMLGILNVTMVPQYGEGNWAFMRLQLLLLSTLTDESLFAWRMPHGGERNLQGWGPDEWGLLALHPSWFKDSTQVSTTGDRGGGGLDEVFSAVPGIFAGTQGGIRIPSRIRVVKAKYLAVAQISVLYGVGVIIWPTLEAVQAKLLSEQKNELIFMLNCWKPDEVGARKRICLHLRRADGRQSAMKRSLVTQLCCNQNEVITTENGTNAVYWWFEVQDSADPKAENSTMTYIQTRFPARDATPRGLVPLATQIQPGR